jgi:hypothetical protein
VGVLTTTLESSFEFMFTGGASFPEEGDSALQTSEDILF